MSTKERLSALESVAVYFRIKLDIGLGIFRHHIGGSARVVGYMTKDGVLLVLSWKKLALLES